MREAKVGDYWKQVYKRSYTDNLCSVNLNGLNGLNTIDITNGIHAICGLNGAGKSTIVSAIKAVIGLPLSDLDKHRIGAQIISGKASHNKQIVDCDNSDGKTLLQKEWSIKDIRYIDCMISTHTQQFLINQTNLDELLEQFEEYELTPDELKDIGYLIGKTYDSCSVRVMEDIDEEERELLYFRVRAGEAEYDSIQMGNGEHFLLYLFWYIANAQNDSLIIIEEPETYISILSQTRFANFLAKNSASKGIKVILTTHSPYILKRMKNSSIRIVSRMPHSISIMPPNDRLTADEILGIASSYKGTIFVEDTVASQLLLTILEDKAPHLLKQYLIEVAGGETQISERLKFPKTKMVKYNFVGVYDGDMRNNLNTDTLQWNYCFLPYSTPFEEQLHRFMLQSENISLIADYIGINLEDLIAVLAKNEGLDHHDWFEELRKFLSIDGKSLVSAFYNTILKNDSNIASFLDDLENALK